MLLLLLGMVAASTGSDQTLVISLDNLTHRVSPDMTGCGLENINHEIYGGLYSQLLWDESFEQPQGSAGPYPTPAPGDELSTTWHFPDGPASYGLVNDTRCFNGAACLELGAGKATVTTTSDAQLGAGAAGKARAVNLGLRDWGLMMNAGGYSSTTIQYRDKTPCVDLV